MRGLQIQVGTESCVLSFSIATYPSCCGANIVHALGVRVGTSEKHHKEVAQTFTKALLAKNRDEMPKNCDWCTFEETYSSALGRYVSTVRSADSVNYSELSGGKICMADAVWGESQDEKRLTLYKIGTLADGWEKSTEALNPKSNRMIVMFDITKGYNDS